MRSYGVITKLKPLTIRVDRVDHTASALPDAALGSIVSFVPAGKRAEQVKMVAASPPRPELYSRSASKAQRRLGGIAFATDGKAIALFVPADSSTYYRRVGDEDDSPTDGGLELGDRACFDVMSDDRFAWNVMTPAQIAAALADAADDDDASDMWSAELGGLPTPPS